ncbi:MAG: glycosyltransferase 87 family protein, partial [Acidimicrobiia bacterium]
RGDPVGSTSGLGEPDLSSNSKGELPLQKGPLDAGVQTALACVVFSVASYLGQVPTTLAALLGLVLLGIGIREGTLPARNSPAWLALLSWFLIIMGILVPTYTRFPHPPRAYFVAGAAILAITVGVVLARPRLTGRLGVALMVLVVVAVAAVGVALVRATEGLGIDVYHLHFQAAQALAKGRSPYDDSVAVFNGAPNAEPGSMIVGYPYPPATAALYAPLTRLTGEPRWINLAAWLLILGLLLGTAVRHRERTGFLIGILIASVPAWPFMVQAGWTEMVSLALLVVAGLAWIRFPMWSAVSLGVAIATKQYFLVTLPLLLLHPAVRGKRSLVALGTAGLTLVPFLILDPSNLWEATVAFHLNTPPRVDSANLVGMLAELGVSWNPPTLLSILLPLLVATMVAFKSRHRSGFMAGLALVLGLFYMVSSQAFTNYWFLIAGLCGLAAFLEEGPEMTAPIGQVGRRPGSAGGSSCRVPAEERTATTKDQDR